MKKRILTLVLSLIMLFGIIPVINITAFAKSGYVARTTSEVGVNFIEAFEGYSQYAYWDYEHYTIGYGNTCGKDEYPAGISEPFAHDLFKRSLPSYEAGLNSFLKSNNIYVTQNQYDALISFTFNFGAYVWNREPTIAKYLKNGIEKYTDKQIADAFGLWVNAGGKKLQALVERRAAEAKLFCTDDFNVTSEMYVITDSLSMRTGPSTAYSSVATLKRGDVVKVTEKRYITDTAWGKTTYNGSDVWFCLDYAKYCHNISESTSLKATCLYKAENVSTGIKLYWKQINGAVGYKIYRQAEGSNSYSLYKTITKNTTVSFTDKSVTASKQYKYYVVSYNNTKDANKSGVSSIYYVKTPTLKSLTKVAAGFKLSWSKQSDVSGYKIMRRADNDSTYTRIATVGSSVTSYTDKTAVSGVKYYYTIKSYTPKGLSGSPEGKSGIFLAAPTINNATNTKNDITISWSAVRSATGYYIFRRVSSESEAKFIKTVNGATSYTDKNVSSSKTYYYYLKSYNADAKSEASSAFEAKIYKPSAISSISSEADGVLLKWKKSAGADSYNIYRRPASSNNYVKIASSNTTQYLDKTASSGNKYYYRLTAVGNGKCESYRSGAKGITYSGSTTITSATVTSKGIKLEWKAVNTAQSYSIYRYSSNKYVLMKTVTATSYTDTKISIGKGRTYAIKVNYSNTVSDYSAHFKAYRFEKPVLKVTKSSGGLLLSWNKIKNATGVIIYRKGPGESKYTLYTKQTSYSKNTFDNTTVKAGGKYSYYIKVTYKNCTSLSSNKVTKTK